MNNNEYTEIEKLTEMGLMGPTLEELGMTEEEYYGPANQTHFITIHPNERFNEEENNALFGLNSTKIAKLSNVDPDVFDSHQYYRSALVVAKEIAQEVNHEIQRAFFNNENSIIEDLRYEYDSRNGTYHHIYEFQGTYSKATGKDVLAEFGIYDDEYFTN